MITERDALTGDNVKRQALIGFRSIPVFAIESTDGDPVDSGDPELDSWISSLPLADVAQSWGINVSAYAGRAGGAYAKFSPGRNAIAIGVKDCGTFFHELVHAADHKAGTLKEAGQHYRSETVAELGAAILLAMYQIDSECTSLGNVYRYIEGYAKTVKKTPVAACFEVLDRTCKAVQAIIDAGNVELETAPADAVQGLGMAQYAGFNEGLGMDNWEC